MRAAALLLLTLASCDRTPAPPSEPAEFSQARAAVLSVLRDPDSARFGAFTPGKPGFVCGTVNAKNGFGGYTGHRAFFWSTGGVGIYEDPADWLEKGIEAEIFADRGCSIGADQERAIEGRRRLSGSGK